MAYRLEDDPIASYFAQYPEFEYTPTPDWRQVGPFKELASQSEWGKERRKKELQKLKRIWEKITEQELRGTSLTRYQQLCLDLDILPPPDTVHLCKKALRTIYVNIFDLVEYRINGRVGGRPTQFKNEKDLKEYSVRKDKIYPKRRAKAEMLQVLLKKLFP